MPTLAELQLTAREEWVPAGGYEFLIRRPSDYARMLWRSEKRSSLPLRMLRECVIGWRGIPGNLIHPGLPADTPPFELEGFLVWIEDKLELMIAIGDAINAATMRREAAEAEAKKK